MKYLLYVTIPIFFLSCKKEEIKTPPSYAASYSVTVSMNWAIPQFSVPEYAHFTHLVGMIHSKDTFLWDVGKFSTTGLENVAEVGDNVVMSNELDAIISSGKALSKFIVSRPLAVGVSDTVLNFNIDFSYISFASMIAPSPDWFIGIHDVDLLQNGQWVDDITINIMAYDAGTEEGDVFSYDNPGSSPRQYIQLLTPANATVLANSNASIAPMGTIRFIKN